MFLYFKLSFDSLTKIFRLKNADVLKIVRKKYIIIYRDDKRCKKGNRFRFGCT